MAFFLSFLAMVFLLSSTADAAETRIKVSVLSQGAKFIGSSLGGARVILRDVETGSVLAQGVTAGTTGDTAKIMLDDREPGQALSSADSAHYSVVLDIDKPHLVAFEVYGPLAQRQSALQATRTQWVLPGKHLDQGDGVFLVIAGMAVDILDPPAHIRLEAGGPSSRDVSVVANVTMMCGCPLSPDGLWPEDAFEVRAVLSHKGRVVKTQDLSLAEDQASRFETTFSVSEQGWYDVFVYAYQETTGNTGFDRSSFAIVR